MKVQRKVMPSEQFILVEESARYYIVVDAICRTLAFDKQEYEPVQGWVDVPISRVCRDTEGRTCNNGPCNSYFFADANGNFLTSDHEPIIIDGKVGLRRRKR